MANKMPEKAIEAGQHPHDNDSFNKDPLAAPWERLQDWTTEGFTEEYCRDLDEANGVTGIGTNYYLYPCRNPNAFDRDNRPRQIKAKYPGSFVVKPAKDEKGDFVSLGEDLMMMAIPMELYRKNHLAIDAAKVADEEGSYVDPQTREVRRPDITDDHGWSEMTLQEKRRYKEQMSRMYHEAGLIGGSSPTAGLPLLQAEEMMAARAAAGRGLTAKEEEESHRQGGRAMPKTQAEYMDIMMSGRERNDPLRKTVQEHVAKKYTAASGARFAPEVNPRSALGQVQARGKGR